MSVKLVDSFSVPEKMSAKNVWNELHLIMSEASSLIYRRINAISFLISRVGTYSGVSEKLWAINEYKRIESLGNILSLRAMMDPCISGWKKFIEVSYFDKLDIVKPSFLDSINQVDFKLTNSFLFMNLNNGQTKNALNPSMIEASGFFYTDTYMPVQNAGNGYYNIKAEVFGDNNTQEEALLTSITYADIGNWFMEDFDKTMSIFPEQGIFVSLVDRKIRFYNRTKVSGKRIGDALWVRFTFFLESGQYVVSEMKEVMVLS